MVLLLSGATHTGKTALAQRLMEKYRMPYVSIDHLKMGLIRSGQTSLTPNDDGELAPYLWSIVKEMVKTAVENEQNCIIEGCYIPFDWQKDFDETYLKHIAFRCLIMSASYIETRFDDIVKFENVIEKRKQRASIHKSALIKENETNLQQCETYRLPYILIDKEYDVTIE